ncbi:uncharacterized protein LOC122757883 [Drosophila mojavensis]|uniref:uncharacterized protein LOC122757883 n=1 Tax=Drosophila mojavensis TaxID=7230 RepID=UPI001CD164F5|nr:uncharacterized protein LOC122757883 [Drosophila mojavensis]
MTLIDGKVLNVLTGTNSCQVCPLCGAKPNQLLKTTDFNSAVFAVNSKSLQFGVSPLHAWIRFLEFVLKISYRLEVKKWRVKGSDKQNVCQRKQYIQRRLRNEMGLNVDSPKQNGSGNTNDGNTARRAFNNVELFSNILSFDDQILRNFYTILITISCEYKVNSWKFKDLCEKTFYMYTAKYIWYPMSPTVHKILVHGHQIMDNCIVPVGVLGENASEARNKIYKNDRKSHARKSSRLENISDVFNRALDSSDPLISSLSLKERARRNRRKNLPSEVVELLEDCSHNTSNQHTGSTESQDEEDDSDGTDEDTYDDNCIELEEEESD